VGQSIACAARVDGKGDRGTALLETEEVIYRGEAARARVPFASIRSLDVRDGWLAIRYGTPTGAGAKLLELDLGARAATWQARIRSPKGLAEKIGVKAGAKVVFVGFEDRALAADLAKAGATVQAEVRGGSGKDELDLIFVRVAEASALTQVKGLAKKLAPDGALWIVRPKGKEGVAEAAVFEAGRGAGLVDVKVAKWSDVDTGMKFVIPKGARAARKAAVPKAKAGKRSARPRLDGPA
jgi:hypothetical protein